MLHRLHEERQRRPRSCAATCPTIGLLEPDLSRYFPAAAARALRRRRSASTALRREIIATQLVNQMVNLSGISFDHRMTEDTGAVGRRRDPGVGGGPRRASTSSPRWDRDRRARRARSPIDVQLDLFLDCRRMVERASLWLLRHRRPPLDIAGGRGPVQTGAHRAGRGRWSRVLVGRMRRHRPLRRGVALAAGVPERLAERSAVWPLLHTGVRRHRAGAAPHRMRRRPSWPRSTGRCSTASTCVAVGRRSARCRAPTAGRPRPARRCATTCWRRWPS